MAIFPAAWATVLILACQLAASRVCALAPPFGSGMLVQEPGSIPPEPRFGNDRRIECPPPLNLLTSIPLLWDNTTYECGLLDVPLDYHDVSAGYGQIYYTRIPANSTIVRKGTIFVDPGFPFGISPTTSSLSWLIHRGSALHRRTGGEYDVVVWQARGKSDGFTSLTVPGPVECFASDFDRAVFWSHAADKEGLHSSWDDVLQSEQFQTDINAYLWPKLQEQVIEHCLKKTNVTMLKYMGTAATVRDLVAMADAFDGPTSPINFWGMGHGSLIGSYLLKMFPERAGRVLFDSPRDPAVYVNKAPFELWKQDITWANDVLARFHQECTSGKEYFGACQIAHLYPDIYTGIDSVKFITLAIAIARKSMLGWNAQIWADEENTITLNLLESVFQNTEPHINETAPNFRADMRETSNLMSIIEDTLGIMPIACGDLAFDHDAPGAFPSTEEFMADLMDSVNIAPLLMQNVVPSMRYMCHLWPHRAVERLNDFSEPTGETTKAEVLVLIHDLDPLSSAAEQWDFRQSLGRRNHVVMQGQLGTPSLAHSRCMSNRISAFLQNGTIPTYSKCYGNGMTAAYPEYHLGWPEDAEDSH